MVPLLYHLHTPQKGLALALNESEEGHPVGSRVTGARELLLERLGNLAESPNSPAPPCQWTSSLSEPFKGDELKPSLTMLTAREAGQNPSQGGWLSPKLLVLERVGSPQLKAVFWAPERLCPTSHKAPDETATSGGTFPQELVSVCSSQRPKSLFKKKKVIIKLFSPKEKSCRAAHLCLQLS